MVKGKVKEAKKGKNKKSDSDNGHKKPLPTIFARDWAIIRLNKPVLHSVKWDESYVIGFSGIRGSGKSLGMALMCARAMMAGKKVWSNLDIAFRGVLGPGMVKTYRSKPLDWDLVLSLDKSLADGIIAIDEFQYFLSNRSSLQLRQRLMNAIISQIRHRSLSLYFTSKSIGILDKIFQSGELDVEVKCWDKSKGQPQIPKGQYFLWKLFDHSGAWTGRENLPEWGNSPTQTYELKHCDRLWPIYSTEIVIDFLDTFRRVQVDMETRYVGDKHQKDAEYLENLAELVGNYVASDNLVVPVNNFVANVAKAFNREADSNKIGRDLAKLGVFRRRTRSGSWYDFSRVELG